MTVTPYSSAAPVHRDVTAPAPQVPAADTAGEGFFGSDGLDFDDFLDLINPLQHLPIISTFYRAATADEISTGSRVLGGALFGGIIAFVAAVVNAFTADTTGKISASMSSRCSTGPARDRESPPPRRHSPPRPAPAGTRRPLRPRPRSSTSARTAARFGAAESATGWVLLMLGQALDKYENVRYAHDTYERRPVTREPVMARLDAIV